MVDYRAIKALNWSSLKSMATSPRLYQWRTEHLRPDSPSLALGRAIHTAILEPDVFSERYIARPEGMKGSTREGKKWLADVGDYEVLTAAQGDVVEECRLAVETHTAARELLVDTQREVTVEWSLDGVACKGRVDAIRHDGLIDLKTSRELAWYSRDSARFLYHGQLAWYRDGAVAAGELDEEAETYMIVVETAAPYDVAPLRVPGWVLAVGRRLYQRLLALWQECHRCGQWPGAYPAVVDLDLPRWADDTDRPEEEEW